MQNDIWMKYGTSGMLKDALKKASFMIEDLIGLEDTVIIAGAPKIGKSWLAAQLAVSLSENKPFLGFACARKFRVLYIDLEMSAAYSAARFKKFYSDDEVFLSNRDLYRSCDFEQMDILSAKGFKDLFDLISHVQPDAIVFDTLSKLHNADENANIAMTNVMSAVKRLGKGRAKIVIHHLSKNTSYGKADASHIRGAGSIVASCDIACVMSKPSKDQYVISVKTRHLPVDDVWLEREKAGFVRVAKKDGRKKTPAAKDVFCALFGDQSTLTSSQLWERFQLSSPGVGQKTMQRGLGKLVEAGTLIKQQVGRECVFSKGVAVFVAE